MTGHMVLLTQEREPFEDHIGRTLEIVEEDEIFTKVVIDFDEAQRYKRWKKTRPVVRLPNHYMPKLISLLD